MSACENLDGLENVETRSGVVSMEAIKRVVSEEEGPAVMALRISVGRAGPTGPCWARRAEAIRC